MPATFALARPTAQRRRLIAGAAAVGVLALAALVLAAAGVGGGRTWVGRVSLAVVAAGLAAVAWVLVRAASAPAGHLELQPGSLVIAHPALLRRPVVLPWSAVRTVLVDSGAGPSAAPATIGGGPELTPLFSLVESGEAAWLHPGARTAMPVLGWDKDVPNVAIVLRADHELGSNPRRLLALLEGNEPLRALATCAGFFLRVDDPDRLAAGLADRDLSPPLTLAEAAELDQRATDRRLGRRR